MYIKSFEKKGVRANLLEPPQPTALLHVLVFVQKTYTWLVPVVFFFRNGKKEERWEGRLGGRCVVCKVWMHTNLLLTRTKSYWKYFQVNCKSNHQTSLWKWELLLLQTTCVQLCGFLTFSWYNSSSNIYHVKHLLEAYKAHPLTMLYDLTLELLQSSWTAVSAAAAFSYL